MSKRRLRPNQSKIDRSRASQRTAWPSLIAAALLSGGVLTPGLIAWANGPAPGTVIQNQATGSFVDPSDSSTQLIESNIVQVTVAEVAGITVASSGYSESTDGAVNNGDTVYFDFVITNVGNDPTQFFIPDAPSAISGGTAGTLQIIAYDADGTGAGAAEDLSGSNITVPNGGDATGNLLNGVANTNNGSVPAGGSITVRVPVTVTGAAGTDVTVMLGNTAAAPNNQNQPYTTPPSDTENVYTVDNLGTTNGDTDGGPLNDEREASDSVTVAIAASTPTPTVTCPTGSSATGGGYAPSGSGQYRDDIFWLDWNCGPTTQFNPGDVVQKTWTGPHGIEVTATVSNITQTLHPYNTGAYFGDRLDELYGGVNPIGLSNLNNGEDPTYDVTFSMTLNGIPIEADIVTAEAESTDGSNEYATWTTDGTPWQLLEAASNSSLNVTFSNGGQTITMDDFANAGPGTLLALTEDVSTISVDMNAGGKEALAFGIMAPFDFGDANGYPLSGGHFARRTATGGSQPTTSTSVNSLTMSTLVNDTPYLGSVGPDIENAENSDQPTVNADGDDSSGLDDEDGITLTTLTEGDTSYTIPVGNITANTTGNATLHAWVDFNQDSSFEVSEYQSVVVTNGTPTGGLTWSGLSGITSGTTYARFRLTTDTNIIASTSEGVAIDGEMEDYQLTIAQASDPNVLLVKRITLLNGDFATTNGDDLAAYIDEATNDYDDNTLTPNLDPADTDQWPDPATFLIGGIDGGDVRPDDEIEYTIYFLSSGDATANNVLFCDRVPEFVDFLPAPFNVQPTADPNGNPTGDRGIVLGLGAGAAAGIAESSLTNEADSDTGYYFPPGVEPVTTFPNINCGGTNDNGAVVVDLGDLPNATAAGEPARSYGFVRFRARVR